MIRPAATRTEVLFQCHTEMFALAIAAFDRAEADIRAGRVAYRTSCHNQCPPRGKRAPLSRFGRIEAKGAANAIIYAMRAPMKRLRPPNATQCTPITWT